MSDLSNQSTVNTAVANPLSKEGMLARNPNASTEDKNKKAIIPYSLNFRLIQKEDNGITSSIIPRRFPLTSSLDILTGKNLKGISGELERLIMPEVIGVSLNDNTFQKAVEDYWGRFRVEVPNYNTKIPEQEQGIEIAVNLLISDQYKNKIESIITVKDKILLLQKGILENQVRLIGIKDTSNFLILSYCCVRRRVATEYKDRYKSNNISFYIYDRELARKAEKEEIDRRTKAIILLSSLSDGTVKENKTKLNEVYYLFKLPLIDNLNHTDKWIKLNTYITEQVFNDDRLNKFIEYMNSVDLDYYYLIARALAENKITNIINTTIYLFDGVMIAESLPDLIGLLKSPNGESTLNILKSQLDIDINFKKEVKKE